MGMACSMHGKYGKCVQNFGHKTRREDLGIDGRIILKYVKQIG
jgi:hypothetical protein